MWVESKLALSNNLIFFRHLFHENRMRWQKFCFRFVTNMKNLVKEHIGTESRTTVLVENGSEKSNYLIGSILTQNFSTHEACTIFYNINVEGSSWWTRQKKKCRKILTLVEVINFWSWSQNRRLEVNELILWQWKILWSKFEILMKVTFMSDINNSCTDTWQF